MAKKASRGTNKIPASANSGGSANDGPRQRDLRVQTTASDMTKKDMDDGPKVGEEGQYAPSTYEITKVRNGQEYKMIVEDH